MAGVFDNQAHIYAAARPSYPSEWFAKLSSLTPGHALAWDAGTGNGQAAVSVARHYDRVVATDVSAPQLAHATPHPRVHYVHTPASMTEDELVALLGGEGSVDLVTVAVAVHWFDLDSFYSVVNRVLRKPDGVIAVWGYWKVRVCPSFDAILQRFFGAAAPYSKSNIHYIYDEYRSLPFPFEGVGVGAEGEPARLEMEKETPFEGFLGLLRSASAVNVAKEQGVDLLGDEMVEELAAAWGGRSLIRTVIYDVFVLAGKPK